MSNLIAKTDWLSEKLKNLPIQIIDGDRSSRYPKRDEFQSEGNLFLNTTNIKQDRLDLTNVNFVTPEKFAQIKKGRLQRLDIVMTTRGSVGKVALFNSREHSTGLINAQMLILRADGRVIDHKFLFYLFCSDTVQGVIRNFSSGAAQPQIPIQDLREIEITYPSLPVQRKIAAILSAYDDLIENNTRRIAILEEMARMIYREWFVHFRFPGHEQARMVESELGPMPEGWEVKRLGDICTILMGQSPKSEFYNEAGEGLPFHQGVKDFGDRFPTDRVYCTLLNRVAEAGDILFSVRAPVGRINIASKKIVIGRGLSAIRNKTGNQVFTFYQLKDLFQEEDTMGGGTIFKAVTKDDMHSIKFLVPPRAIIVAFEEIVIPISDQIENLTAKNANLRRTRDLLLPRLISGELDVAGLEIELGGLDT
jgi:type I restriction enzyme S subunit